MPEPEFSSYLLAGHTDLSIETLEKLARSPYVSVRRHLAENTRDLLPVAIRLLRDSEVEVRIALTDNADMLPLISPDLARDESSDVRFALAENIAAPLMVLETLAQDENPYVASRAIKSLQRLKSTGAFAAAPIAA